MKPEQKDEIFPSNKGRYSKYLKKITNKNRRRIEKILLENAPKKNEYRGWSD